MLVYNGNVQCLDKFVFWLKVHMKITDYEIIVVDNRISKSENLEVDDCVLVQAEGNQGILEGRRIGFEASKNEYIWFVDIDDTVMDINDVDYGDEDIIFFSDKCERININNGNEIIEKLNADEFTVMVWDKWINRKVLVKAYEQIPHFFCIYSEDVILLLSCSQFIKTIARNKFFIYHHYDDNEISITSRHIKDKSEVDILFEGFDEYKEYVSSNYKEYYDFNFDKSIKFYLGIYNKAYENIKEYFLNKLYSLYGKENVDRLMIQ